MDLPRHTTQEQLKEVLERGQLVGLAPSNQVVAVQEETNCKGSIAKKGDLPWMCVGDCLSRAKDLLTEVPIGLLHGHVTFEEHLEVYVSSAGIRSYILEAEDVAGDLGGDLLARKSAVRNGDRGEEGVGSKGLEDVLAHIARHRMELLSGIKD